jgi:hypothetical protein
MSNQPGKAQDLKQTVSQANRTRLASERLRNVVEEERVPGNIEVWVPDANINITNNYVQPPSKKRKLPTDFGAQGLSGDPFFDASQSLTAQQSGESWALEGYQAFGITPSHTSFSTYDQSFAFQQASLGQQSSNTNALEAHWNNSYRNQSFSVQQWNSSVASPRNPTLCFQPSQAAVQRQWYLNSGAQQAPGVQYRQGLQQYTGSRRINQHPIQPSKLSQVVNANETPRSQTPAQSGSNDTKSRIQVVPSQATAAALSVQPFPSTHGLQDLDIVNRGSNSSGRIDNAQGAQTVISQAQNIAPRKQFFPQPDQQFISPSVYGFDPFQILQPDHQAPGTCASTIQGYDNATSNMLGFVGMGTNTGLFDFQDNTQSLLPNFTHLPEMFQESYTSNQTNLAGSFMSHSIKDIYSNASQSIGTQGKQKSAPSNMTNRQHFPVPQIRNPIGYTQDSQIASTPQRSGFTNRFVPISQPQGFAIAQDFPTIDQSASFGFQTNITSSIPYNYYPQGNSNADSLDQQGLLPPFNTFSGSFDPQVNFTNDYQAQPDPHISPSYLPSQQSHHIGQVQNTSPESASQFSSPSEPQSEIRGQHEWQNSNPLGLKPSLLLPLSLCGDGSDTTPSGNSGSPGSTDRPKRYSTFHPPLTPHQAARPYPLEQTSEPTKGLWPPKYEETPTRLILHKANPEVHKEPTYKKYHRSLSADGNEADRKQSLRHRSQVYNRNRWERLQKDFIHSETPSTPEEVTHLARNILYTPGNFEHLNTPSEEDFNQTPPTLGTTDTEIVTADLNPFSQALTYQGPAQRSYGEQPPIQQNPTKRSAVDQTATTQRPSKQLKTTNLSGSQPPPDTSIAEAFPDRLFQTTEHSPPRVGATTTAGAANNLTGSVAGETPTRGKY